MDMDMDMDMNMNKTKLLKWRDDRPDKIRIKSKYITIKPKQGDTQIYLERLIKYDECAKWIEEIVMKDLIENANAPDDIIEFVINTNQQKFVDDLDKLDYTELREAYPNIKYSRSKKGFIENIINQIEN